MNIWNVHDFGATGNGTSDDTVAINNALTAAKKDNGGVVLFPRGVYKITSTLLLQADHVTLRGVSGALDYRSEHAANVNALIASAPTRIVWGGSTGGVMVKFDVGQVGTAWINHQGCGLQDIVLDGAAIAGTCFLSLSHNNIRMKNVSVVRYTTYGYSLGVTNNSNVVDWGSGQNLFEHCVASNYGVTTITNDHALALWGDALKGNLCYTSFVSCTFVSDPTTRNATYMNVTIEQADNCQFFGCYWNYSLYLHADDTGVLSTGAQYPSCAIVHTFYGCYGRVVAKASTRVGGNSSGQNVFYGYRLGGRDAVQYPTIEQGADLTVYCNSTVNGGGFFTSGSGGLSYGEGLAAAHVFGSTQSIANNTLTTVTWPSAFYDPFAAATTGQILIPQGIKWARATAQIIWAVNTAGWRYAEIGATTGVECKQWCPSTPWDGAMMLCSQWFPVYAGDTVGLNVKHNAGTNLALSSATLLQVEFK